MPIEQPRLMFDVPGGRLIFGARDLDLWAEHLTWCYRMLGVPDGATIAVQDFGNSPLSFLGSRLLMPWLDAGIAERMDGRFIGLDASSERTTLTPALLNQLTVDALVIRWEVVELLQLELRKKGVPDLSHFGMKIIVAINDEPQALATEWPNGWRRLLHIESSLILAPDCEQCGCFHLRDGIYETGGREIRNHRLAAPAHELSSGEIIPAGGCAGGGSSWRIRLEDSARGN